MFKLEQLLDLPKLRSSVCGTITLDWRVILRVSAAAKKPQASGAVVKAASAAQAGSSSSSSSSNNNNNGSVDGGSGGRDDDEEEEDEEDELEPLCDIQLSVAECREVLQVCARGAEAWRGGGGALCGDLPV